MNRGNNIRGGEKNMPPCQPSLMSSGNPQTRWSLHCVLQAPSSHAGLQVRPLNPWSLLSVPPSS
jgi:hypothetical protein